MIDTFTDGTLSVTPVLLPNGEGWQENPLTRTEKEMVAQGHPVRMFVHPRYRLQVISSVEFVAEGLDRLEYHISISKRLEALGAYRCDGPEARWVLAQFGLDGAEEDNHVPGGVVRNFWRPVADNLVGLECPCKEEEPAIVEDKGDYIWRGAKT